MDVTKALGISASGLSAQRARMEAIGENLANTDTTRTATGQPYRRKTVVVESAPAEGAFAGEARAAGVRVRGVAESQEPFRRVHRPDHPHADADGYVQMPNVNPVREMTDMLTTTRAYEANATAFQATKSMGAKLLELLR